ncbi:hypothetical protein WDW86_09590 [Bdellovibrionota bacterium FG-2]
MNRKTSPPLDSRISKFEVEILRKESSELAFLKPEKAAHILAAWMKLAAEVTKLKKKAG